MRRLINRVSSLASVLDDLLTMFMLDTPELVHERLIRSVFPYINTGRMLDVLKHMTGYYNRYFDDIHGELSSRWLHDHISQVCVLHSTISSRKEGY
jgi:leucyl aminopeptidase